MVGLAGKTEFDDAKAAMICEAAEEAFLTLTWKINWEFAHDQDLEKRVSTSMKNILSGIYFIFSTNILILSSLTTHEIRGVSFFSHHRKGKLTSTNQRFYQNIFGTLKNRLEKRATSLVMK